MGKGKCAFHCLSSASSHWALSTLASISPADLVKDDSHGDDGPANSSFVALRRRFGLCQLLVGGLQCRHSELNRGVVHIGQRDLLEEPLAVAPSIERLVD